MVDPDVRADGESVPGGSLPVGRVPAAGRHAVREAVLRHGYAVCHGRLDEWGEGGGETVSVAREVLGPDWPRYRTAREPLVRARLLGSRLLLRHVVAAVAGTEPSRVVVGRDGNGRPVLHRPAGLDVGISHTAGMLVVGVARGRRIGVDVEASDRPLLAPGLAEKFCHPEELAELSGLPPAERNLRLVRLWTLKEAYTKALGVGLAHDFSSLRLRPEPRGEGWRLDRTTGGWHLHCEQVGRFLVAGALGPERGWADGAP
ncbi:4'-phosphopantetheinyl transferase family protein [Streptomyces sp. A30]|uniref:4'-phosphopantetheinyl transferase family protein n=1 Tax=Streptomyces sp. A30 TaxID=2789273 RepID=UPI0039809647